VSQQYIMKKCQCGAGLPVSLDQSEIKCKLCGAVYEVHRVHGRVQRVNGQIIRQYPVPFPTSLGLGAGETSKSVEVSVDVMWDERKTVFNQALLTFSAHIWRGVFSIRALEARLYINDNVVIAHGWSTWEGRCVTKSSETNIGAYLINGTNKFRLELVGSWELITAGIDAISVKFEAWFTGEPPIVKPTEPQWLTYLKWGAVGLGILGVAYLGIRVYESRKKRE